MDAGRWRQLDDRYSVYRYDLSAGSTQMGSGLPPVLFLQPTQAGLGTPLADMFGADGFANLYSYPVTDVGNEASMRLAEIVDWLMRRYHPQHQRLIVVGCGEGGLLGRRYLMLDGYERIAYLFTLGSGHRYSQLAYLRGSIMEQREGADEPPPVVAPSLDNTVMVNIYSEFLVPDIDPQWQGGQLSSAVNLALPLHQEALYRDVLTYQAIRRSLQGQMWLVSVRLQSLDMRGARPEEERTGAFCFEVNGWRAPFDGVFRVPVNTRYEFDPAVTQLGTMAYPLTEAGRAVDIDFRLKDLSPLRGKRRKLFASLHTPLRGGVVSNQLLQDSMGSEVGIQVRCDRPASVLSVNHGQRS